MGREDVVCKSQILFFDNQHHLEGKRGKKGILSDTEGWQITVTLRE